VFTAAGARWYSVAINRLISAGRPVRRRAVDRHGFHLGDCEHRPVGGIDGSGRRHLCIPVLTGGFCGRARGEWQPGNQDHGQQPVREARDPPCIVPAIQKCVPKVLPP
jgi:hypothetical protein